MVVKVFYEESGVNSELSPVWMVVEHYSFDWDRTLFVDIEAPFERLTLAEIDNDMRGVSVPAAAYTRHTDRDQLVGISLPQIKRTSLKCIKATTKRHFRILLELVV